MTLNFQYTLDEWIELRRQAACRPIQASLIYIGEAAFIPLAAVLGSVTSLVFLEFFGIDIPTRGMLPRWVFFIPLIALAVTEVYLTACAELRKKVLTRNWQEHGSRLRYSIDVSEGGIVFKSTNPESLVTWDLFNGVFQTRSFYLVRREEDSLYIPKRILKHENDEEEFLDLLYKKMVVERTDHGYLKSNVHRNSTPTSRRGQA